MKPYKHPHAKCNTCHKVLGKLAIKKKATRKCCFSSFVIHYGFNVACQKYGIMNTPSTAIKQLRLLERRLQIFQDLLKITEEKK